MNVAADTTSDKNAQYAHPERLVTTQWLADHLGTPGLVVVESDEDVLLYDIGHVPNAQKVDWHEDLNDPITRDYVSREAFQTLLRRLGIDESTTVVFYGDKSNWWATYAYWVFQLFGFTNAKIVNGGRTKWEQEGRALVGDVPSFPPSQYVAPERVDAASQLGEKAHLVPGAAIALRHQDCIEEDRDNQAFRIVELGNCPQPIERLAACGLGIRKRFGSPDEPVHDTDSLTASSKDIAPSSEHSDFELRTCLAPLLCPEGHLRFRRPPE